MIETIPEITCSIHNEKLNPDAKSANGYFCAKCKSSDSVITVLIQKLNSIRALSEWA